MLATVNFEKERLAEDRKAAAASHAAANEPRGAHGTLTACGVKVRTTQRFGLSSGNPAQKTSKFNSPPGRGFLALSRKIRDHSP